MKTQISDGFALLPKLLLVVGFNFVQYGKFFAPGLPINVEKGYFLVQPHGIQYAAGVSVEKLAVGFEVDLPFRGQHFAVAFQKIGVGEAVFGTAPLDLWIGKGNPDLANCSGVEAAVDEFNTGAQEGRIAQILLGGG